MFCSNKVKCFLFLFVCNLFLLAILLVGWEKVPHPPEPFSQNFDQGIYRPQFSNHTSVFVVDILRNVRSKNSETVQILGTFFCFTREECEGRGGKLSITTVRAAFSREAQVPHTYLRQFLRQDGTQTLKSELKKVSIRLDLVECSFTAITSSETHSSQTALFEIICNIPPQTHGERSFIFLWLSDTIVQLEVPSRGQVGRSLKGTPQNPQLVACLSNPVQGEISQEQIMLWIEYYRNVIGVSHFFIYVAESKLSFMPILIEYSRSGFVTLVDWSQVNLLGTKGIPQTLGNQHCASLSQGLESKYTTFFDLDEFLYIAPIQGLLSSTKAARTQMNKLETCHSGQVVPYEYHLNYENFEPVTMESVPVSPSLETWKFSLGDEVFFVNRSIILTSLDSSKKYLNLLPLLGILEEYVDKNRSDQKKAYYFSFNAWSWTPSISVFGHQRELDKFGLDDTSELAKFVKGVIRHAYPLKECHDKFILRSDSLNGLQALGIHRIDGQAMEVKVDPHIAFIRHNARQSNQTRSELPLKDMQEGLKDGRLVYSYEFVPLGKKVMETIHHRTNEFQEMLIKSPIPPSSNKDFWENLLVGDQRR